MTDGRDECGLHIRFSARTKPCKIEFCLQTIFCESITKTKWLMLFMETIAVYSKEQRVVINRLCGKDEELD